MKKSLLTRIFHKISVAAVYDRRWAGEAMVIDRRYSLAGISGWCEISRLTPCNRIARHRPRGQKAQALTEFLLLLPVMLVIILAVVQLVVLMDRNQKVQMSTWFAMRSQSYDSDHSYYNQGTVQDTIKKNMFGSKDSVSVGYQTSPSLVSLAGLMDPFMFAEEIEATVTCGTPYLFNGSSFSMLQEIFQNVVQDGKIAVSAENQMIQNQVRW